MSVARPAQADRIELHEGEDGLVLHHTMTRVHHLNPSASVVFELCDGTRTTDAIVELVRAVWNLEEPPRQAVIDCLARLRAEGVVV